MTDCNVSIDDIRTEVLHGFGLNDKSGFLRLSWQRKSA